MSPRWLAALVFVIGCSNTRVSLQPPESNERTVRDDAGVVETDSAPRPTHVGCVRETLDPATGDLLSTFREILDAEGRPLESAEIRSSGASVVSTYAYDASGRISKVTRAGKDIASFEYDGTRATFSKPAVPGDSAVLLAFDLDAEGRIVAEYEPTTSSEARRRWTWTSDGRVSSYTGPAGTQKWSYDDEGLVVGTEIHFATGDEVRRTFEWTKTAESVSVDVVQAGTILSSLHCGFDGAGRFVSATYTNPDWTTYEAFTHSDGAVTVAGGEGKGVLKLWRFRAGCSFPTRAELARAFAPAAFVFPAFVDPRPSRDPFARGVEIGSPLAIPYSGVGFTEASID